MKTLIRKLKTTQRLYKQWGFRNTCRFIRSKITGGAFVPVIKPKAHALTISDYVEMHFRNVQPLDILKIEENTKRLNLVTDSIASNSLLGGVATALIIATEYARQNEMSLRIITRTEPVAPGNYVTLLANNGLEPFDDVEFFSDFDRTVDGTARYKLPVAPGDVFFATSWWSAAAIEKTLPGKKYFYIIQEVETFFYPHGQEHYLCSKLLESDNIVYIINSKYLYDYYVENVPKVAENGIYFKPAFSEKLYQRTTFEKSQENYRMFFYARPNNPRNMYGYGLKLINLAVERGIIDMEKWEICFAGSELENMEFSNGTKPVNMGLMSWKEYSEFMRTVDLSVSLMYTPHPSYPPYDAACSGAVVLTNTCLNKRDFSDCKNIIMSDLEEEAFMSKLQEAVALAQDFETRKKNYDALTIPRDWLDVLEDTLTYMREKIDV